MVAYALQTHTISRAELRTVSIDFSSSLDQGDTLTGTPVVTHDPNIEVTQQQVNSTALQINYSSVAPGHAIQFRVNAAAAVAGHYTVAVACDTVSGDIPEGRICLKVID